MCAVAAYFFFRLFTNYYECWGAASKLWENACSALRPCTHIHCGSPYYCQSAIFFRRGVCPLNKPSEIWWSNFKSAPFEAAFYGKAIFYSSILQIRKPLRAAELFCYHLLCRIDEDDFYYYHRLLCILQSANSKKTSQGAKNNSNEKVRGMTEGPCNAIFVVFPNRWKKSQNPLARNNEDGSILRRLQFL